MMIKGDSSDTSCRAAISIILMHWPESRYALYQHRQDKSKRIQCNILTVPLFIITKKWIDFKK